MALLDDESEIPATSAFVASHAEATKKRKRSGKKGKVFLEDKVSLQALRLGDAAACKSSYSWNTGELTSGSRTNLPEDRVGR